ncbi:hypothetical protein AGDE_11039 [Angomonas deanei]|uniref:Flagellar attachment zone protein 1 conserved domain-containing protein n=1 Tax=Angomonas deanei TaxID=59799 RepID=A0A7G2CN60_9TRYP|nr:hypothetical protein AGDE_11039 [Angomonas deanei]CAD2221278.1 hypothetical protein, conserved [Angomonas deanei]|eukprot:EPY26893.1 hypothetical protein AGDE_11039 [Angomonas deanei]
MSSHHSEEDYQQEITHDPNTENVVTQAAALEDSEQFGSISDASQVDVQKPAEEEEEQQQQQDEEQPEQPQEQQERAVAVQHTVEEIHLGDYVAYERVTPQRDWSHLMGKVIGFPSANTVKVARFDAVNAASPVQDPKTEEELKKTAEQEDKLQLWHDREDLRKQLTSIEEEERSGTERLLAARDATLLKQQQGSEQTARALEALDATRTKLQSIPPRQWRDLRSNGEPAPVIANLIRAVMLVLHEDRAKSWDLIQGVLREPNFMDRLLDWDCTVTPMSVSRRRKVVQLCAEQDVPKVGQKKKKRASSPYSENNVVAPAGEGTGSFAVLDSSCRAWINAQLAASDAGDAQARLMEECFAEQQDQRFLLREVNDIRVNVAKVEAQIHEAKLAILGIDSEEQLVLPVAAYKAEGTYYKAVLRGDEAGRFVQDLLLRQSVLINFGPAADEDTDGYVHLTEEQLQALESAVHESYKHHDAEEMENLALRKELEEQEIKELRDRIEQLRSQGQLSPEEAEELEQLERALADAERRHENTVTRMTNLHTVGRGVKEITVASKKPEFKYTRLHCKMAGDWTEILNDPTRHGEMVAALQDDLALMLNIPRENIFDVEARAGSLLIDFTVKHSGELDDEELQQLVNNGDFSSLGGFYEKVTFKKTGPLNTAEQEEAFNQPPEPQEVNFSGLGVKQTLSDYYNSDGELEEDYSPEVLSDVDYRKAKITIPPVREDFDVQAVQLLHDGTLISDKNTTQVDSCLGLTETRGGATLDDGTLPGTTIQQQKMNTVAVAPGVDSQASSNESSLHKASAASSEAAEETQPQQEEEEEEQYRELGSSGKAETTSHHTSEQQQQEEQQEEKKESSVAASSAAPEAATETPVPAQQSEANESVDLREL